ncbi:hypothetical protein CYMTET_48117 [Cymbomonas tetramitiformis]|uniref:Uncharacterized protein n=1 Tax=Cymbomonas tetramitiformis TaxID=36881 RepID=A0AAE0BUR5_9CHLO|nr:hypothetical protein CYMTET_48117 [Cymbomonas tetramitiformis]
MKGRANDKTSASTDTASLSRLLEFARPEARPIALAFATVAVTSGIQLLFPLAFGHILDLALQPVPAMPAEYVAFGLLGMFAVNGVLISLRSALLMLSGERIAASIRSRLFAAMLSQEVAYFDRRATGDLMNVMASDTVFVQKGLTNNAVTMMRSGVSAVGGAGLLVYLSPTLAAVSLCLIPPLGFMAMKFGRYLRDQQKEVQEALSRILETSESVVSNIRTVRQFDQEHREMSTFDDRVQHSYHESRKVGVPQAVFDGMAYLAGNMALVAVLGYGGSMVTSGAITAGELTSFLMYSMSVGLSVMSMFSAYTDAMRAAGAGVRIVEVMDRESLMPSNAGGRTLPSFRGDVSFHDVHFTYPSRPNVSVLTGLSLHVPPGRVLALVGASGCGKSTVGALLTALYAVDRGSIRFDGVDLQDLDPRWVRRAIGVVAQEPVLFSGNILDNLRYGMPYATRAEVEAVAMKANAHDFISQFPDGYETLVGERGLQLSGGQKQRLAIARALLKDPAVLVLDEATSALDAESERAVQSALEAAMKGRTVVTIAHRLSTMRSADTVALLQDGRIAELGTYTELAATEGDSFDRVYILSAALVYVLDCALNIQEAGRSTQA